MIIYQPWIEFGGPDGEYATRAFSFHLHRQSAFRELVEKNQEIGVIEGMVIIKKGMNEISVIEEE
jgi:hypothetical protein